eukprot:TRINITY_DN1567_c0_g1_i4.p1 TRINITY_DN1567_c0_g1~~TRINITY_DN1567_c0_g1_i4.p1  ORF type:complete len:294 (+),score=71.08 TRINITY_DN1567_c0_g1_i4:72-953(+)
MINSAVLEDETIWDKLRKVEQEQKIILINLVVQLLMCIILYILFILNRGKNSEETFFVMASFLVFVVSQYYFAIDSVIGANAFEMFVFISMSFLTWVGVLFKSIGYYLKIIRINKNSFIPYGILVVDFILTINQVFYFYTGSKAYNIMKWKTFKKLGASVDLQENYKNFTLYRSQTKFTSALAFIGFFTMAYIDEHDWLKISGDFLLVVIAQTFIVLGFYGASKGLKTWIYTYFVVAFIYWVYRVVRMVLSNHAEIKKHNSIRGFISELKSEEIGLLLLGIVAGKDILMLWLF